MPVPRLKVLQRSPCSFDSLLSPEVAPRLGADFAAMEMDDDLAHDFAAMDVDDEKRRKRDNDTPGGPRKRREQPREVR